MAIDTLKVARRLREAGFSEAQAEALVTAVQEGAAGADLATKADLALLRAELGARIDALGARIDALGTRIDGVGARIDGVDARVEAVQAAIETAIEARIEAAKAEILYRVFQMILGAVLINIVAMAGLLFAFAKLLGH